MPVPLPTDEDALQVPPDAAEARFLAGGIAAAVATDSGLTALQRLLVEAITESMTGFAVPVTAVPKPGPEAFARGLARRSALFRTRIVQLMTLAELVLVPLPPDVAERVETYAAELSVSEEFVSTARKLANGSLGLALIDFQRSGYMETWDPAHTEALHTSRALEEAWAFRTDDPALAARWESLADCPDGSLGQAVTRFYEARGFSFPGLPQSAPPLLAQHDWVHVLTDYGSTVESEIEVFAFIARANDDPRGFSLLAMVVSLFETGYLGSGAGLFHSDRGHLSEPGMPARLADAMRRGALCAAKCSAATGRGCDLLEVDWFAHAERPIDDVRAEFGIVPKSERAIAAGSVGPWSPGGISPYQYKTGRAAAETAGQEYNSYGAVPVGVVTDGGSNA
jgi:hypothetical protein